MIENCVVVTLPDQIDMLFSAAIERELQSLFQKKNASNFILDLSNVTLISSSGLRIFITAKRKLRSMNREIVLCGIKDESVSETLRVSNLKDILMVFPTETDAAEYLAGLDDQA